MRTVSLAEAKAHLSELVSQASSGEEFVITRHGQPIARLAGLEKPKVAVGSRAGFRSRLPRLPETSANLIRSLREDES